MRNHRTNHPYSKSLHIHSYLALTSQSHNGAVCVLSPRSYTYFAAALPPYCICCCICRCLSCRCVSQRTLDGFSRMFGPPTAFSWQGHEDRLAHSHTHRHTLGGFHNPSARFILPSMYFFFNLNSAALMHCVCLFFPERSSLGLRSILTWIPGIFFMKKKKKSCQKLFSRILTQNPCLKFYFILFLFFNIFFLFSFSL